MAQAVTVDGHAEVLGLQYIPEQPQQPVIDAPEEAGHAMRRIEGQVMVGWLLSLRSSRYGWMSGELG